MASPSEIVFFDIHHDHQDCISKALLAAEDLCRQQGQRFTALRRQVLELVWRRHRPVGAYELLELLQREGKAAPPTVYRTLDFLQQMGLVHRIATLNAYIGCARPGVPHEGHFLICECCRSLAEIESPAISEAIEASAHGSGFDARRHTVEILGLCPHCRNAEI